ncbi:hypothetical protein LC55x_3610 [Lysobacter capsici]|nr:hypothetical protein LC55x_3610 [Lysobacter capsici]
MIGGVAVCANSRWRRSCVFAVAACAAPTGRGRCMRIGRSLTAFVGAARAATAKLQR